MALALTCGSSAHFELMCVCGGREVGAPLRSVARAGPAPPRCVSEADCSLPAGGLGILVGNQLAMSV